MSELHDTSSIDNVPLISVIVPAYNAEQHIEESLLSLVNQTWPNLEVIVIDDGSTDRTATVVEKLCKTYPVLTLHRKENGGVSSARNLGLDIAKGDYIALQDADDIAHPQRIEKQLAYMQQHKLALCGCTLSMFGRKKKEKQYPEADAQLKANCLFFGKGIAGPAILFSQKAVGDIRFNETIRYGEDGDFILRVAFRDNNRVGNIQQLLYFYRQHAQQATAQLKQTNRDNMVSIIHNFLSQQGVSITEEECAHHFDLCRSAKHKKPVKQCQQPVNIRLWADLISFLEKHGSSGRHISDKLLYGLKLAYKSGQEDSPATDFLRQQLTLPDRIKLQVFRLFV